jgi:hypothetical protein
MAVSVGGRGGRAVEVGGTFWFWAQPEDEKMTKTSRVRKNRFKLAPFSRMV